MRTPPNDTPPATVEGNRSSSLAARTDTVCRHISNCTSGLGATTPTVRSWTGITT